MIISWGVSVKFLFIYFLSTACMNDGAFITTTGSFVGFAFYFIFTSQVCL